MVKTNAVYFGGSRHHKNIDLAQVRAVVAAVVEIGANVHVGCQFGADAIVITAFLHTTAPCSKLHLFAVSAHAPQWFNTPAMLGASVTLSAGGTTAPIPARYLLRSIAAFQGCAAAVFFAPGAGSLSVARHALAAGIPVFIFAATAPTLPVPARRATFQGFACWQYTPATQPTLF